MINPDQMRDMYNEKRDDININTAAHLHAHRVNIVNAIENTIAKTVDAWEPETPHSVAPTSVNIPMSTLIEAANIPDNTYYRYAVAEYVKTLAEKNGWKTNDYTASSNTILLYAA